MKLMQTDSIYRTNMLGLRALVCAERCAAETVTHPIPF